jgi:hypothetical protein
VNNFNISRINTPLGIFRVSGFWCNKRLATSTMDIDSIEIMGTDGWVLLNQSSASFVRIINELTPIFLTHLRAKSS